MVPIRPHTYSLPAPVMRTRIPTLRRRFFACWPLDFTSFMGRGDYFLKTRRDSDGKDGTRHAARPRI